MSEQGLYVLSPNPVYDVMGEGASTAFFCKFSFVGTFLMLNFFKV